MTDRNEAPHPGLDNINRNQRVEQARIQSELPTWEWDGTYDWEDDHAERMDRDAGTLADLY
jgi:hypothetical protein